MRKGVCVFGDSVVWGACLPKREAWADLLRNYLEAKSQFEVELYNLGIDRDTSTNLLARIELEASVRRPDVIIIAIGANDSIFRLNKHQDVTELQFIENLNSLLNIAFTFTKKVVFVGLGKGDDTDTVPLKRSTTGKCYSKEVTKLYNDYIKKFSFDHDIPFVDVFGQLTDADFDDGLHPNIAGHKKIFDLVRNKLEDQGIVEFLLS